MELVRSAAGDLVLDNANSDPAALYEAVDGVAAVSRIVDRLYGELPVSWAEEAGPGLLQISVGLIARLAILVADGDRGRPFHAVTYNFDTTLEEAIAAQGHWAVAMTASGREATWPPSQSGPGLFRTSLVRTPRVVRVAHPHGLIVRPGRRDPCTGTEFPISRPDLIIGADDYDRSTLVPFANHNLWQLAAFSTLTCFFYGWSFTDFAVRRLLRVSSTLRQVSLLKRRPFHIALIKSKETEFQRLQLRVLERSQHVRTILTSDPKYEDQKTFLRLVLQKLNIITRQSGRFSGRNRTVHRMPST
jgi:hypothetical protein